MENWIVLKNLQALVNHQLLWHDSRTTNFARILSQGLRIPPPEAPVVSSLSLLQIFASCQSLIDRLHVCQRCSFC